ncbi:MAG: TMEM175 family protein [Bacteroidota bacterium]
MTLSRKHTKKSEKDRIRWRGQEVSRIEAFSDAVFAFAVTLMVVSLEVPKNYEELKHLMKGFLPFAICFAIFFQVWTTQNKFFRRYGLHDRMTLTLNAVLLFLMLFFAYPLKFMWSTIFRFEAAFQTPEQASELFCIYGLGFAAIYLLFAIMYRHAYNLREHLHLTESEVFETRTHIYINTGMACVGLFSATLAALGPNYVSYAGMSYMLIGLVVTLTYTRRGKLHRKKFEMEPTSVKIDEPAIAE